ncbi:MAG TPA: hypothetical protein VIT42_13175 [Microlunatus sp.]
MTTAYDPTRTGVLLIDPYNDFLHEDGKLWPMVGDVVTATGTVANMKSVVDAARDVGIRIVVVPHHRWVDGDHDQWKFPTGTQRGSAHVRLVERDSWGGTFMTTSRSGPAHARRPFRQRADLRSRHRHGAGADRGSLTVDQLTDVLAPSRRP